MTMFLRDSCRPIYIKLTRSSTQGPRSIPRRRMSGFPLPFTHRRMSCVITRWRNMSMGALMNIAQQ